MRNKKDYEIERMCVFCEFSKNIYDDEHVLCDKHGVVCSNYCCKRFSYDPLKREPKRIKLSTNNDFSNSNDL